MSRRDVIENAARIAQLGIPIRETAEIMSLSRRLRRIGERQCNGYHDPAAEKRDERAEARHIARAVEIAKAHGLKVYHQGDPRGCALYLYRPADLRRRAKVYGETAEIGSCYSSVGIAVYA